MFKGGWCKCKCLNGGWCNCKCLREVDVIVNV